MSGAMIVTRQGSRHGLVLRDEWIDEGQVEVVIGNDDSDVKATVLTHEEAMKLIVHVARIAQVTPSEMADLLVEIEA